MVGADLTPEAEAELRARVAAEAASMTEPSPAHVARLVALRDAATLRRAREAASRESAPRRGRRRRSRPNAPEASPLPPANPGPAHGPMRRPCGCPLDADCSGYHPGALDGWPP